MKEDKSQLLNYAMHAGLFLGGFWILKYLFTMVGSGNQIVSLINFILSIGTPVLLFHFLVKYNTNVLHQPMGYGHGIQFSIVLFFFASILESLIVFIHVNWIDPAFIATLYGNMIEVAQTMNLSQSLIDRLSEQAPPSPFGYVFNNVIMGNVLLGLLLSIPIVPLAIRYNPTRNLH